MGSRRTNRWPWWCHVVSWNVFINIGSNRCWLIISEVLSLSVEGNSTGNTPWYQSLKWFWKVHIKNYNHISQGRMIWLIDFFINVVSNQMLHSEFWFVFVWKFVALLLLSTHCGLPPSDTIVWQHTLWLAPSRCQAITWTNGDILSVESLGTIFNQIWIKVQYLPRKCICIFFLQFFSHFIEDSKG